MSFRRPTVRRLSKTMWEDRDLLFEKDAWPYLTHASSRPSLSATLPHCGRRAMLRGTAQLFCDCPRVHPPPNQHQTSCGVNVG